MKYPDHHMRHPRGHNGDRASAQGTRGCAWRDDQFGRGQNPVLGWSDPLLHTIPWPKCLVGRSSPTRNFPGARGENLVEAAEEGRNYLLQLRLQHLLQLGNAHKSRENEEMNDTRMRKVTEKKTPDWAGATPLFRLSAAQKVRGVAPARHARSVTVCCPRAQRELLRRTSETIFPLATHCSRIELNRRAEGKRLFSQRHKWPITRNHKLTRHTLRRTQLGSVDADFLHRVTGSASFLRALLNSRGEESFTLVIHGALYRSLHWSAARGLARCKGGSDPTL